MLTLYYSPGAISLAPHIVLHELGLPHQLSRVVTGEEEHRRPEYLRINPLAQVPALALEDGTVLTEVAAILQYLAALAPQQELIPTDPLARARCHQLLSVFGTSVHPAYAMLRRPDRMVADPIAHAAMRTAGRARFVALLQHLDSRMSSEPWLLGAQYSVADPYLMVLVLWARNLEIDLSSMPRLTSWASRFSQRPAFGKALRAEGLIDAAGRPNPPQVV